MLIRMPIALSACSPIQWQPSSLVGPCQPTGPPRYASRMGETFRARGWGTLAVVPKDRSACVGYCGVRPLTQTADVEIAFALDPSCWNLGYATEAARASIDAAFEALDFGSIVATVYPDNTASCRVLTKLGLMPCGRVFGIWPREFALLFKIDRSAWEVGRTPPG